ncbi:MAG TPA: DUF1508 domain-containing protein [Fimbriimonadaceae bacterium]|nr:DUF1508 domain-containing protein [Fimbriimonadaceae bacterium]
MTFQVFQDRKGEWHWRLLAGNNRTIANSVEGYVRRLDCLHSVWLVKRCRRARVVFVDR